MRDKRLIGALLSVLLIVFMSGCEVEPTPLPPDAFIVTESTLTPDALVPGDRYAITRTLASLYPAWTGTYPDTTQIVEEEPISAVDYDLLVGVGTVPEGAQQAGALTVGLIAAGELPPLDNPALRDIIVQIPLPDAIAIEAWTITPIIRATLSASDIRERLANAGSPDGISLTLAAPDGFPIEAIEQQFTNANVRLIVSRYAGESPLELIRDAQAHLVLMAWLDADFASVQSAAGEGNIMPMFTTPIHYVVDPARSAILNNSGLPILSD